jgi:hypothetical protein|tara:strand:+ start:710 stop:973 length:264 start_codon:yes stop_codon:yes gene_type:complete
MTVGDIISENNNAFQPSAGTEIMVTWVEMGAGANRSWGVQNGTLYQYNYFNSTSPFANPNNVKLGITNTWYFYNNDAGLGFVGIQIK